MFNRPVRTLLVGLIVFLLVPAAAQARVIVVATNTADAVLLDTRSNSVAGTVALPGRTRAVAAAPDGGRAFVAAGITVSVIDLNTRLGAAAS